MIPACIKCAATPAHVYQDGDMWHCTKCGKLWEIVPGSVYNKRRPAPNKPARPIVKSNPDAPLRACSNCGRPDKVIAKTLCRNCYWFVYKGGHPEGSPGYITALARAKKIYSRPGYNAQSQSAKHFTHESHEF
jgi:hypothetical protein